MGKGVQISSNMTFDSIVMAAVADELNRKLTAGRVDKIAQPTELDVVLTIRSIGANWNLLISADAQSPRVYFTSIKKPNPQVPPNFCMLMRKYLEGARFVMAEQVDFDRILRLKFVAYDGEPLTLIVEIMGKHSNAILVNAAGRILGTIKPVGRTKSRYREVLPGKDYVYPPSQNKLNPLLVTSEQFRELLLAKPETSTHIAAWLTKTFTGISPFAARELVARTGGDPSLLEDEFLALFTGIRAGEFLPVLITDDEGRSIGFYAFPSVQYPESNQHERDTISIAAENYYSSAMPRNTFQQSKETLIGRLEKELESRRHALGTILAGITEGGNAERYKQIAELILSQASAITAESESAELLDYYDPNAPTITVRLDPQLNAAENAEAYFRKYRKAVSGAEALRGRLAETQADLHLLETILGKANSASYEDDIRTLTELLASGGIQFLKQDHIEVEKRKAEFDGHRISRVMSGAWEILVGHNSDANDYLITRIAKPNDYWLHVKASPSAHVVIRTNGKPEKVPKSVLNEAAELTAQNSDSKHSSLVPVDYTLRKYVRKPKGAPAGKAIYQNEKTIYITP